MTRVVSVHTSSLVNLAMNTPRVPCSHKAHSERIKTFVFPWNEHFFYRSARPHVSAETNFYFGFDFILFHHRYFFMRHSSNRNLSSIAMCFRMWPTIILYGFAIVPRGWKLYPLNLSVGHAQGASFSLTKSKYIYLWPLARIVDHERYRVSFSRTKVRRFYLSGSLLRLSHKSVSIPIDIWTKKNYETREKGNARAARRRVNINRKFIRYHSFARIFSSRWGCSVIHLSCADTKENLI